MIWGIPGVIAYVLFLYLKSGNNFILLRKEKAQLRFVRVLFFGFLLVLIVSADIAIIFETGGSTAGTIVITAKEFGESFYAIVTGVFNLYGNAYESPLFSSSGILKCINFYIAILFNIFIPVFAIRNFSNIKSDFSKFIVLFSIVSSSIYLMLAFFIGAAFAEDCYLISVYNNNILLFAVTGSYILQRYFKRFLRLGMFLCSFVCIVE